MSWARAMLSLAVLSVPTMGRTAPAHTELSFLPGPVNPEDLVAIPHSRWLIASNFLMEGGKEKPGDLYLIDRRRRIWTTMLSHADFSGPAAAEYSACPGPPARDRFGSHGLALREGSHGHHQLYVVNHVGRESVEILEVEPERNSVRLRWVGCVLMPAGSLPNAVAPLPDGGFVVTSMFDRSDPDRWKKLAEGIYTGAVYRWEPKEGLTRVPGTEASGNNGIVADATGTLFVAAWAGKAVLRMKWNKGVITRESVPLEFLPDNLRWAPDGSILVAGQKRDLHKFFEPCQPGPCRIPWVAARLNPNTLQVTTIIESEGTDFSDATTALEVDNEIWLGSAHSDRVAAIRRTRRPSLSRSNIITN